LRVWRAALAVRTWNGPPLWLHGDLHPANILVSGGRLSAVIDFGDVTAGDPATDLSVAWMLLPTGVHAAFRSGYTAMSGSVLDDDSWERARGWALALSVAVLARSADNPLMAAIGRRTIRRLGCGPSG
jgi:aminoglycoside phosphotransferase (APT) family kinase protein